MEYSRNYGELYRSCSNVTRGSSHKVHLTHFAFNGSFQHSLRVRDDYLFVVCLFIATWAIFQLSGGCHHCRWQGCKSRPMFDVQGLGGIFVVPHLLRHGTSVYTVSSKRPAPTSHSGIRTPDARILAPDALTTAPWEDYLDITMKPEAHVKESATQ
jgi:hypothetical protein